MNNHRNVFYKMKDEKESILRCSGFLKFEKKNSF
jgi:hypothetical protein